MAAEQTEALRDLDLAAHQVDAGDHLGDGVLHLDARIHFDEVPGAGIGIHQELHGSGVVIAGGARQLDGGFGQRAADGIVEAHGGRHFHHLLMPPLHGAIALIEVQQVAGAIAQDLHLDVAGALDVALQKHRIVAERRAGLAPRFRQPLAEFRGAVHHAHAAPAAAEGRLDDQRKADAPRDALGLARVGDRIFGAGHGGNAGALGQLPGRALVAEQFEQLRAGTDERDAGPLAGARQSRILRQEIRSPGWMASTPFSLASATMPSTSR
jgi:hypothetical protein